MPLPHGLASTLNLLTDLTEARDFTLNQCFRYRIP